MNQTKKSKPRETIIKSSVNKRSTVGEKGYSDFDSSIVTSRRFSPHISTTSIFPGYTPDYSDDYESELADVFYYSCFDEGEKYIVRIKFDYIKHNTTIAFPSVIFIKEPFGAMPYTITSRNSPEAVSGEIRITDCI